jgi:phosphate acetyltransferase
MDLLQRMKVKAKSKQKTLVFPEGNDLRILKAAKCVNDEGLAASITVLGKEADINKFASQEGVSLAGINVLDPVSSPNFKKYAKEYYELRKHKGMTPEQANAGIVDPLRWGSMMVRMGDADTLVAGAEATTADVLRAGLTIIGMMSGMKTASSNFILQSQNRSWGVDGAFIFSDGGVVPDPTPEQLADIALASAQSCRDFLDAEPAVALLSFSTKGSGGDQPSVLKVREALAIIKKRDPGLLIDGELQSDAAIIPSVTDKKAPGSPIRGKTNVMIFPDINAANIGIKLAQRFGNLDGYGPFLQGFMKPISDLSRGASVEEIVNTCAITLAQAK